MELGSVVCPAAAAGTSQAAFGTCWKQLSLQLAGIETIKRKMKLEAALAAGRFRGMCRVKYRDAPVESREGLIS